MMLIKHDEGGVSLPKYKLFFPKGEAVEVKDEKLAAKILRNTAFSEVTGKAVVSKKKKEKSSVVGVMASTFKKSDSDKDGEE